MNKPLNAVAAALAALNVEYYSEYDFISVKGGGYEIVISFDPDDEDLLDAGLYEPEFKLLESIEMITSKTPADVVYFTLGYIL